MLGKGSHSKYQNFDNWVENKWSFHDPADVVENLASMVEEEGSIFPVPKDEMIRVEELYKCSELSDDILGLNGSNQRMHYNFEEYLTLEYHPTVIDHDIPEPNLSDEVEFFCEGILGEAGESFTHEKSTFSDSHEDSLADSKSVTEASVIASIQDLDNLKVDLRDPFRDSFGHKTPLENLLPLDDNHSNTAVLTNNQCPKLGWSLYSNVFIFKKKPRIQRAKRKWSVNNVPLKVLSSEGDANLEENNVQVATKRSRKCTRRSAEERVKQDKNMSEEFTTRQPKKQRYNRISAAKRLICSKKTSNRECNQVPFGEIVLSELTEEKVDPPKDLKKDTGHVKLNIDTEAEFSPIEPENILKYDSNEDKMNNSTRRKHHIYWSISEVLKLVEGVSLLGVGRWNNIRKLMFNSSPSRSAVDLKDKWRNLLRASCSKSKRNREAELRKPLEQQVPESILLRVKELSSTYPHPRTKPNKALKDSYVFSPIPDSAKEDCLAMSTGSEKSSVG